MQLALLASIPQNSRGRSYTRIGYVSENQEIPEWMKVGALLDYLRDFYPTWDLALEQSLVKQFDLPLDRKIKALSRGMKMKLALAGALAFHPPSLRSAITKAMSGRFWLVWAGARNARRGEHENAMKSRSSIGKRTCGRS